MCCANECIVLFVCLTEQLIHLITVSLCERASKSDSFNWVNNSLYMAIMPCSLVCFMFGSARLSTYCFCTFQSNTKRGVKSMIQKTHPSFKSETNISIRLNQFESCMRARVESRFLKWQAQKSSGIHKSYNMDLRWSIWFGISLHLN